MNLKIVRHNKDWAVMAADMADDDPDGLVAHGFDTEAEALEWAGKSESQRKAFNLPNQRIIVVQAKEARLEALVTRVEAELADNLVGSPGGNRGADPLYDHLARAVNELETARMLIQKRRKECEMTYPLKFRILWGRNPDGDSPPAEYEFKTRAEVAAFWQGASDADGWNAHTLLEDGDVIVRDADGNISLEDEGVAVVDKDGKRLVREFRRL